MQKQSRRDLFRVASAAGLALSAVNLPAFPSGEIAVRVTEGERRFAEEQPLHWTPRKSLARNTILIEPDQRYQEILGFGGALTDAACYVLSRMPEPQRSSLLNDLFHSDQLGMQVCRICIGSSDYSRNVYSFDEGEPDPEMQRFSIEHDNEYILPTLRAIRSINPGLFLLASPWSPPGWMKPNGSMLGGCTHPKSFPAYARYFSKFLQSYAHAGVPVQAVSVQNEVDTEQDGRMPACLFSQEYEIGFVTEHLAPQLTRDGLNTKIWILDHNYNLWGRVLCELENDRLRAAVDGVAWHGYVGEPSAMTRVHDAYPDKHMYWTEGGPDITDPHYAGDWANWGETFSGILRNWARCIICWNVALDQAGKPNIGPFTCGGLVTVHSGTQDITRSGQYWAFAHYTRAFRPGAMRISSSGDIAGVSHTAGINRDGGTSLVIVNKAEAQKVNLQIGGSGAEINLPANSLVNLTWSA